MLFSRQEDPFLYLALFYYYLNHKSKFLLKSQTNHHYSFRSLPMNNQYYYNKSSSILVFFLLILILVLASIQILTKHVSFFNLAILIATFLILYSGQNDPIYFQVCIFINLTCIFKNLLAFASQELYILNSIQELYSEIKIAVMWIIALLYSLLLSWRFYENSLLREIIQYEDEQ